jgi:hypothetical protein
MRVAPAFLVRFLRQQIVYIAISAIAGAVFWAIGQQINPLTVLVYSIAIGNTVVPVTQRLHKYYSGRPFPYNWVFFLGILLVLLIPVYIFSSVVVWLLAPPTPQTLGHLLRTGWKFPVLITFVASVLIFLYQTTKEKLERRNTELQRSVDLGTEQLEMQEQELQRAREIQQSLLPREIPQLPGFEVAGIWRPARAVSGDYYDVIKLGRHKLGICVADVVGKGVSAALLMANVQAAVHAFASESESAACLCGKVNALLYENIAIGKFVTFSMECSMAMHGPCSTAMPEILTRSSSLVARPGRSKRAAPSWAFFLRGLMRMRRLICGRETAYCSSRTESLKHQARTNWSLAKQTLRSLREPTPSAQRAN